MATIFISIVHIYNKTRCHDTQPYYLRLTYSCVIKPALKVFDRFKPLLVVNNFFNKYMFHISIIKVHYFHYMLNMKF